MMEDLLAMYVPWVGAIGGLLALLIVAVYAVTHIFLHTPKKRRKTMAIKCPNCGSEKFYYKQRVDEFYTMDSIDKDGNVEFLCLESSHVVADVNPHLRCDNCKDEMTLDTYARLVKEKK